MIIQKLTTVVDLVHLIKGNCRKRFTLNDYGLTKVTEMFLGLLEQLSLLLAYIWFYGARIRINWDQDQTMIE